MKVALVVPGGVDRTGIRRVIPCLLWLIERLSREHEVHVFAMRGDGSGDRYPLRGATVHDVPGNGRRTVPTLRALVREHRRGPFALVHAFWASGPGVVAALARPWVRTPVLLHTTGGDLASLPDIGYGGRLRLSGRLRVRLALAAATRRTAPSAPVLEAAAALGFPAERLPMGVSRAGWETRTPCPRDPGSPARLIHVGSLNRVKDQATLLRAARRIAEADAAFTLDVVGQDTLDGEVQRLAAGLGIGDRTRFRGFVPQAELMPLVARAHLMLVSSRHEAEPVAVAEAAMVGVPTVGTDVGLLREWAPDAAVVVPVGDDEALAGAALALLGDERRRQAVAEAARQRALARDADWTARQVLRLYDTLTR